MGKNYGLEVGKRDILRRGMHHCCPNCGGKTLFRGRLSMNETCSRCGMAFERGEGFFLGSMSLNYIVTVLGYLLPILVLALIGWIPAKLTIALAVVGAIMVPILLYRSTRSWWLMAYFYFLPHELPANRAGVSRYEDEA